LGDADGLFDPKQEKNANAFFDPGAHYDGTMRLPVIRHYRNRGRPSGGERIVASARILSRRIHENSSSETPESVKDYWMISTEHFFQTLTTRHCGPAVSMTSSVFSFEEDIERLLGTGGHYGVVGDDDSTGV
jgi:hypothetical protein